MAVKREYYIVVVLATATVFSAGVLIYQMHSMQDIQQKLKTESLNKSQTLDEPTGEKERVTLLKSDYEVLKEASNEIQEERRDKEIRQQQKIQNLKNKLEEENDTIQDYREWIEHRNYQIDARREEVKENTKEDINFNSRTDRYADVYTDYINLVVEYTQAYHECDIVQDCSVQGLKPLENIGEK